MEAGQKRVLEFHRAFNQLAPEKLTPLRDPKVLELRCKLLLEEVLEFCAAAGFCPWLSADVDAHGVDLTIDRIALEPVPDTVDDVAMADALGDIKYVADGAAVCMGLDMEPVEIEIHRSNLSKLGADGKPIVREDGKCLKGPNYSPPDIAAAINIQINGPK